MSLTWSSLPVVFCSRLHYCVGARSICKLVRPTPIESMQLFPHCGRITRPGLLSLSRWLNAVFWTAFSNVDVWQLRLQLNEFQNNSYFVDSSSVGINYLTYARVWLATLAALIPIYFGVRWLLIRAYGSSALFPTLHWTRVMSWIGSKISLPQALFTLYIVLVVRHE